LRGAIESIRQSLTDTLSSIYARIDYPEEDLGDFTDSECLERLKDTEAALLCLASTYRTGRAIAEGVDTVICGRPNVGKSTLYNLLLGYDAAIVTDIPGTTRDTLSATVSLGRATLNLSDTAGIRGGENIDAVEKIGIMRSRENIRRAELILALFDLSSLPDEEDFALLSELRECSGAKICIFTKSDLDCTDTKYRDAIAGTHFDAVISISAKAKPEDALAELEKTVSRLFIDEELLPSKSAIVATARQHAALLRALDFIGSAKLALESGIPQDAVSSDIELALGAISELDGRAVADSVVSDIFSKFCVGK
jgi:tRNA modification GTPase